MPKELALQLPQEDRMNLFLLSMAVMCAFPVQNAIASDSVLLDDLLSGEVVVEGKSGVPIGTVVPGFLKTVIEDKNSTTITVETEGERDFTYRNDRKYDHFAYVLGERNAPQALTSLGSDPVFCLREVDAAKITC